MKKPLLVTVAIAALIIGYLIYDNYQKSSMITDLQSQSYSPGLSEAKQDVIFTEDKAERDYAKERLEARKKGYRNNFNRYITVDRGQFSYREIGGIYDLNFTAHNYTEEIIESLSIEIDYVLASGKVFKTEVVTFSNIPPNGKVTVTAPDSNRGTDINYRISSIYAPAYNFCYPGNLEGTSNESDPFYCM